MIKLLNFVEVLRQGYSLNNVYILQAIKDELSPEELLNFPSGKAIIQGMIRKGLITYTCKMTELGENLLKLAYSDLTDVRVERIDKVVRQERADLFETWWSAFPGTDTFSYKGRSFSGTRALRTKKDECRLLFDKIVREGFTVDEMIGSLNYEVIQKKEDSCKRGENKLRFMQNSLTYLRQRTWEPYIELLRQGNKVEQEVNTAVSNTTDI
jgi:hypothetical protein